MTLSENTYDKFDAIAKRVIDYYNDKIVPSGKNLTGYDDLLLDIREKRKVAHDAVIAAEIDFNVFSCQADDPKGAIRQFNEDMRTVKRTLKNYRGSIKNLIVAIHSISAVTN